MNNVTQLKPVLVGGTSVKSSEEKTKSEKIRRPKIPATRIKKPAVATVKVTAKPAKTTVKAGKIPLFKDAISTPIKAAKVDFADATSVANSILSAAAKAFNSKHNAVKIAKTIVGSVDPAHKKAVAGVVDAKVGNAIVAAEADKVARKIDATVSSAVKQAAKGKLDKPGLAALTATAVAHVGGAAPKAVVKASANKVAAPKIAKKKKRA